jgi:hypothetical protein
MSKSLKSAKFFCPFLCQKLTFCQLFLLWLVLICDMFLTKFSAFVQKLLWHMLCKQTERKQNYTISTIGLHIIMKRITN